MTDHSDIAGALDAALNLAAPGRASVRIDGEAGAFRASIILDVTGLAENSRTALEQNVRDAAARVEGVASVRVAQTSQRSSRTIIAVASGKGGVGKSTLSANLAIGLKALGRNTGLVDADIYGPSQPMLMGVEGSRPTAHESLLVPVQTPFGVPLLSMGQLVEPDVAIAWRGPMAAGALGQLIDANWGLADTLVVDLPPGTGDVQLTMIQKHKPAGVVIVSTPQDLALIDAARAIDLFEKAGVPIIGLVENMAGYACPHCGEVSDPFGRGGAEAAAAAMGIDFLGRIPLDMAIRSASDAGVPPASGNGPEALAFNGVSARIFDWIEQRK